MPSCSGRALSSSVVFEKVHECVLAPLMGQKLFKILVSAGFGIPSFLVAQPALSHASLAEFRHSCVEVSDGMMVFHYLVTRRHPPGRTRTSETLDRWNGGSSPTRILESPSRI